MPLKHRTIIGSLLSIGKPAGGAEDARPENDGQSLSKRRTNLRFLENSGPLFAPHTSRKKTPIYTTRQSQTWYGVCWACHYFQLTISSTHCRISASPLLPTDHTAVGFSYWWLASENSSYPPESQTNARTANYSDRALLLHYSTSLSRTVSEIGLLRCSGTRNSLRPL